MRTWETQLNLPAEFVVWMLGAIGLLFSFSVHLLIRILSKINQVATDFGIWKTEVGFRLGALEKEERRP
jgi:hypothetical protein